MLKSGAAGICILLTASLFVPGKAAQGADTLPYLQRNLSYGTNEATPRGDMRTVGMAAAVIGLADTAIASLDNPSGQAMTLNLGDLNFATNQIYDRNIQNFDSPVMSHHFGAAVAPYPWGFGIAAITPYREGQEYAFPSAGGQTGTMSITAQELHLSASRVLLENRLAAGLTLRFGTAFEEIDVIGARKEWVSTVGATLGLMAQLDDRVLLGLGYSTPMNYRFEGAVQPVELPGFFRNLQSPYRLSFGVGWVPNRFFRLGSTFNIIGPTPGAALLKDETIAVGQSITLQPRFGFNYVFADYRDFEGQLFGGTYLEVSRIQNAASRLHFTAGFEIKPWILAMGAAMDVSSNYQNFILGVGVNVLKTMEKLELIPKIYSPQRRGMVKPTFDNSDEGLARPLVANWNPESAPLDPIQIVLEIPKKLETKIEQIREPKSPPSPKRAKKRQKKKPAPKAPKTIKN